MFLFHKNSSYLSGKKASKRLFSSVANIKERVGGGGALNKVLYGKAPPELQTITFLYTIFDRKGTPFVYLPQEMVPLPYTYGATFTPENPPPPLKCSEESAVRRACSRYFESPF